jgi:hypothetical protein
MINPLSLPANQLIMLNSLYLYAKNISSLLFIRDRNVVLNDLKRYGNAFFDGSQPEVDREQALGQAMDWLVHARMAMKDGGIGSYHLVDGWSASYPETSGYIIPTMIVYGGLTGNDRFVDMAVEVADWLLSIQKDSGGWQGGRIGEGQPEIVFNTGQVIRGMLAAYAHNKGEKYLAAAVKAGNWLCSVQDQGGYWRENALMGAERVYDSYVDVPLIMLSGISGDGKYKDAAIRNLDWIIEKKQKPNGWFEDCDNTVKHNDRPILHTIAYTIDGLLDAGIQLDRADYKNAGIRAAARLKELFLRDGYLHGRYDSGWKGSEYMIVTGCAQMSIAWMKIFVLNGDKDYLNASVKMNDLLVRIQARKIHETDKTLGAVPGSFPVWGKYEPFAFPNWATKYFSDALILEQNIHQH